MPRIVQRSSIGLLTIWIFAELCSRLAFAKRQVSGRYQDDEDGWRANDLSVQEAVNSSLSEMEDDMEDDEEAWLEGDLEEDQPEWQKKTCNPFKRFASKSYYFDLKSGKSYVAIELKKVRSPQGLYLNIHFEQVWRIKQKDKRSKVTFQPVSPPKAKSPSKMTIDLLNDNVSIKSFLADAKDGKKIPGIEFKLASGKSLSFAGGSYYPAFRVRRALAKAKAQAESQAERKVIYANEGNVNVVITPALEVLKVAAGAILINVPFFAIGLSFAHNSFLFANPIGPLLPINLLLATTVGVITYNKQKKKKHDAKLSAAEKIHEVIWCLAAKKEKCGLFNAGKNCFLVCDDDPDKKGSYVFVRPMVAKNKNYQCK